MGLLLGYHWCFWGTKRRGMTRGLGELISFRPNRNNPWLCFGDFNSYLWLEEKISLVPPNRPQMELFHDVVQQCTLIDLGFWGEAFTWTNNRDEDANTKERLDRAIATLDWCSLFPNVVVKHVDIVGFERCPNFIHLDHKIKLVRTR